MWYRYQLLLSWLLALSCASSDRHQSAPPRRTTDKDSWETAARWTTSVHWCRHWNLAWLHKSTTFCHWDWWLVDCYERPSRWRRPTLTTDEINCLHTAVHTLQLHSASSPLRCSASHQWSQLLWLQQMINSSNQLQRILFATKNIRYHSDMISHNQVVIRD